jgi:hypothetical protein
VRRTAIELPLVPREAKAVQQMAKAKGISRDELIRTWVLQQTPAQITYALLRAKDMA